MENKNDFFGWMFTYMTFFALIYFAEKLNQILKILKEILEEMPSYKREKAKLIQLKCSQVFKKEKVLQELKETV